MHPKKVINSLFLKVLGDHLNLLIK